MGDKSVLHTFMKLVSIPSPSGHEAAVAQYIKSELARAGIASHTDSSGKRTGSDTGNLIARIDGNGPTVMFVAHMDTVEDGTRAIRAVVSRGVVRSRGDTVLGVDNKAAVASLMWVLKELNKAKERPTVIGVFSTREERGRMGARYLGVRGRADFVFVLDGSEPPGAFINGSLGHVPFEIRLHGRKAHAALAPEKGAHAIKAAALLISGLKLGRAGNGSTSNIGRIEGGTSVNVIPDEVTVYGEARAFTARALEAKLRQIGRAAEKACSKTGCRYDLVLRRSEGVRPFAVSKASRIALVAKRAADAAGLAYSIGRRSSTCEANAMSPRWHPILGVCRGGSSPHSNSESITTAELLQAKELILELARQAYKSRIRVPNGT